MERRIAVLVTLAAFSLAATFGWSKHAPAVSASGDVNCDSRVDSVDAALILQFDAALIAGLPCQSEADVNLDGRINSVDASLVLQHAAGLIDALRCAGQPLGASDGEPNPAPSQGRGIVGLTTRGIIHYGKGDLLPLSLPGDVTRTLQELRDMNVTQIRVWVGNRHISDAEAAGRLEEFLDLAEQRGIRVVAALIDFFDSGFTAQGMESFYSPNPKWGTVELNHDFFAGGWKGRYRDFVTEVVSRNAGHPALRAWEPGNELKHDAHPDEFVSFMKEITTHIRALDPETPISTGMIAASSTGLHASELYPELPEVDVISAHTYDRARNQWAGRLGEEDVEWAVANGKDAIVGEFAFGGTGNRSADAEDEIGYWRERGVETLYWWGFLADRLGRDNGDGDIRFGMDTIWHTDYDALFELFCTTNELD